MSYPTLDRKLAQELATELIAARDEGLDLLAIAVDEATQGVEQQSGPDYDRQLVERAADQMRKDLLGERSSSELLAYGREVPGGQTALEAQMAGRMHAVLSQLDVRILQDENFWRYLALFPFRWYLLAREPELKPQDFGGTRPRIKDGALAGVQGTSMKLQLILRTYLWGKCAHDTNDTAGGPGNTYRRATAITDDGPSIIDVWHSHIIRVQLGHLGSVPHAFVDVSAEVPLKTKEARELEKLLTRMKHTVCLDSYSYEEVRELVEAQIPMARERAAVEDSSD